MKQKLTGKGGLVAYRGSNSFTVLKEAVIRGDRAACLLYETMAYQISQEIAKHSATLKGVVDRIIITGGMAYDETFVNKIRERVSHIAKAAVIPSEREMLSLARGVLEVLQKKQPIKEYA